MEKTKGSKFNLDDIIEQYRWWIGFVLLLLVIFSGGYLLWREPKMNNESGIMNNGEKIGELELKLQNQESRIAGLESKINESNSLASKQSDNEAIDSGTVAGTSTSSAATATVPNGKINLNTASAAQLDTLPGIGSAYAGRIIEYRQNSGGFKTIEEIKNVKGIGEKTFEKIKELISV